MLKVLNRACIGRNLAIMQLHIIVATLFRRYDLALKSDEPVSCLPCRLMTVCQLIHPQLRVRDSLARRPLDCIVGITHRK